LRKFLALFVAMMLVFGLAAFAAAEVTIKGDARARGISVDKDNTPTDAKRYYDSRIRLQIKGTNDDEAGVAIQWTAIEPTSTNKSWGRYSQNGNATPSGDYSVRYDADDYAYLYVTTGIGKVSAGLMPADWGHKFWAWGTAKERLKLVTKMDDVTLGVFTEKVADTQDNNTGGNNLKDYDAHAVFAIGTAGEFKVGAIAVLQQDKRPTAAACPACTETGKDASGTKFDVFFSGAAGGASIAGELAYNTGELNKKNAKDVTDPTAKGSDSPMGAFVAANMDMDAFKASAAFAMTMNNYVANKYFTPTALIGTSSPIAVLDFGGWGGNATAVVLGATTNLSDAMSVGVTGAYYMGSPWKESQEKKNGGDGDVTITEFDVNFGYSLGEKTKYSAVYAYAKPDGEKTGTGNYNAITAMMHTISLSFE